MKFNNSKFIIHNSTLLLFLSLLLVTSCDTTNPSSNNKITLTFEDASCTEAWLNLKLDNITLPTKVNIVKNDTTIITTNINSNDTTLFIEHLLPSQNYTFYSTIKQLNNEAINSNKATVTTMDTTSHNFTWQTFTFGGVNGSSYLKDVAIINENNIWAVGEIHTAETDQWNEDSTKWVQPYNAVHWDGNEWELKRILVDFRGKPILLGLYNIFAFSDNEIWLVGEGSPIYGDGENWKLYQLWDLGILDDNDGGVNSIWGTSINNLYFVGSKGTIVHYNGSSWTKIESGTEKNIYGIYGDFNPLTNKYEILAVASNRLSNTKEVDILRINNYTSEKIATTPIAQPLLSLWFKPNKKYYLVGSGIYAKNSLIENKWKILPWNISNYFKYCIVAQNMNDIIIAGAFNEVLHFNGVAWKSYRGTELPYESGRLLGANYKNNIICIVGQHGREGVLHIGKK